MKNLFKISLKFQFRSKTTKYNILFLTIMTLLLVFLFTYKDTLKNYLNVDVYNRTFTLFFANKISDKEDYVWTTKQLDEMQKEIQNIPHVLFTTYQYAFGTYFQIPEFANDRLDGYAMVYAASNDTLPEIVNGIEFPDDKENYLICPDNFYPTAVYDQRKELTSKDKINIDTYLNKQITLEFDSRIGKHETQDFKLIGTYKNDENNFDEDICYANKSAMIDVGKKLYKDYIDEVSGLKVIDEQSQIFIQIDSFENTESVKQELQNLGYVVENGFTFSPDGFDKTFQKLDIFIVMSILCIFIIEIILFRNSKIENENNFNLLYVLGYKKKNILVTYIFSNILQIAISLIISILLFLIGMTILHSILNLYPFMLNKFKICINYLSPVIVILLTFLSALINYFSIRSKINGEFHETENDSL